MSSFSRFRPLAAAAAAAANSFGGGRVKKILAQNKKKTVAKVTLLGVGGVGVGVSGVGGVIGGVDDEERPPTLADAAVSAAKGFGPVVSAAEKDDDGRFGNTDNLLHKSLVTNADNDNNNNKENDNNNGKPELPFVVAAPANGDSAQCGKGCSMDDAAGRQPHISEPMLIFGTEVDGLDQTMEALASENFTLNAEAADEDEDEEEHHDEDFDKSKANPFNKGIEQLVDEALRWHDKLMSSPSGRCQPYDQEPEESFGKWVHEADAMFRQRKFEDLKEKLLEEYLKKKGRMAKRDPQLLWRMARLTFLMGNEVENNTIAFWKDAMIYAIEGIKNFEDEKRVARVEDVKQINHNCCWKCHLWFGIIMCKLGGLLGKDQRKRISVAFMAKMHLERAVQINPLDPIPQFALAKWHYEFCKLSGGQMKIVRELGYETPPTNVETALRYAERANQLTPKLIGGVVGKFPRNTYLLAELYFRTNQREKAKHFVDALVYQLGPFCYSMEDRRAVERGKILSQRLRNPVPNNPHDSTPRAGKARPDVTDYPNHHNN